MYQVHFSMLLLAGLLWPGNARGQLTDYKPVTGLTRRSPQQVVLRHWRENGKDTYWLVNPQTLKTSVQTLPGGDVRLLSRDDLRHQLAGTPYGRALRDEQQRDGSLQDAGIERADTTERGFSLTIDLCPSTKPLTRSVFETLIQAFLPEEKPIPVTITITGLWMASHADDLAYLKSLVSRGELAVTWVNHTYHHRYDPARPLWADFLLETGTNVADEVLLNEQAMLQRGLTPSIFFRFPGLVSSKAIFEQILGFGLLPIGSDAWLAKGQTPRQGSLVLIHANGNEPVGIADFTRLVRQRAESIRYKTWLLYELPASLADAEK